MVRAISELIVSLIELGVTALSFSKPCTFQGNAGRLSLSHAPMTAKPWRNQKVTVAVSVST